MPDDIQPVLTRLDADREGAIERWKSLLRIPSISTDGAFRDDVRRAAEWLSSTLADIGFEARILETEGHPMVVAHHAGPGDHAPHLLYYGHYDVQPPEPLELWDNPPFEPTLVDGPRGKRMVARGAVDDKGQVMSWLEAFRAWHAVHGGLPVRVTVLLEGEEECGSTSLEPFLGAHRELFEGAQACVVSDTGLWDVDTPAISTLLRGLVYGEVTLTGPSHDLHSGVYGGAVPNPIHVLARILGELHDDDGRVRIPHFYDDVREPDEREKQQWAALPFDEAEFFGSVGLTRSVGEIGRSPLERMWSRPALDVNGIWGGYTGEGSKTVIPAKAQAKLSCRLVPDQDPEKVIAGLNTFLRDRTPRDCRITFEATGRSRALRIPTGSPYLHAAARALTDVFGREPALIGVGGSIPAVEAIKRLFGIDSLLVGFGLKDDRMHSPNEKFELVCFERGARTHARLLAEFARLPPAGAGA